MESYVNIDIEEITINKNEFPLKFVFLCFMYLIISISINNRMAEIKPFIHSKFKNEFNFQDKLFPFNRFKTGENGTYFNINKINYKFSYEFNIVQVEYYFGVYDKNNKLIVPSDYAFYYEIHFMCNLQIPSNNINIESMANIYKDKYHKCVEFFKINEEVLFGIKIYVNNDNMDNKYFFLFNQERFNFNNITYKDEDYFNPNIIKISHDILLNNYEDIRINETLKLRQSYEIYPCTTLRRDVLLSEDHWFYRNVFNHHFCMCKGNNCLRSNVTEKCKYYFYVSIIDSNRDVYKKTGYAFMDFVKADLSSDDTYPVFKQMLNLGVPAYYITGNLDLYKEHCGEDQYCKKILLAPKELKPIYGDFLEKYISIFFTLKVLISGRPNFNTDLFYNMEYVTYVCVGHGICVFKDYLFNPERIYGIRRNDKIILPDSEILVDIVKKHGWKEEDIFRVNLLRWDRLYDMEQENLLEAEQREKEEIERIKMIENEMAKNNFNNMTQYIEQNNTDNQSYNYIDNQQNNNMAQQEKINYDYNNISNYQYNTNQTHQYHNNSEISNNQVQMNNTNETISFKEQNTTKINLTGSTNNTTETRRKLKTNSILIMFTWRDLQLKKQISFDYFKNFYNILENDNLYKELKLRNITVYLSFHRLVKDKYINKFKNIITERPLIEFISQQEISECLGRTSLVVTDFSSIIFDLMYRKKPFIIYIPDGNDPTLRTIYKPDYYGLIEAMKNGTIEFENKFFSINEAIEKIIFYVQNNFALDEKLERFYQTYGFKMEKQIGKFIDYLLKLN